MSAKSGKMNNRNCCVYNCASKAGQDTQLSFHSFPKVDERMVKIKNKFGAEEKVDRRKAWILAVKTDKTVTPSMVVCSLHFKKEDFFPELPHDLGRKRSVLLKSAVPSLNLPTRSHFSHVQERKPRSSGTSYNSGPASEKENISVYTTPESMTAYEGEPSAAENMTKEKSTRDVGVQVDEHSFTEPFVSLLDTDKKVNTLTGIKSMRMLDAIIDCVAELDFHKRRPRFSVRERVIMTLMKLKCNMLFAVLAIFFRTTQPTCKTIFAETISMLATVMSPLIEYLPKEEILQNMPICFNDFKDVRIVIDCTEIPINVRKCLCCRLKSYSHYKSKCTVKFMTGVSPGGVITFISKAFGGRASDKAIFEESKLIKLLIPAEDAIMVDKGFLIDQIAAENFIKVIRPPFFKKKKQFSLTESTVTRKIAAARVHVERVNQRIKLFSILNSPISVNMLPFVDQIFVTICGVVNLSPPILNDNKF